MLENLENLAPVHRRHARRLFSEDDVEKVRGFEAQRFGVVELRDEHVAGAVHREERIGRPRFAESAALHAGVVDANFFGRLKIVEQHHAFRAAEDRLPKFHRREPAHMNVRLEPVVERQVQVTVLFRWTLMTAAVGVERPERREIANLPEIREVVYSLFP